MNIIINADDLGYSKHRDAGIFAAFEKECITSASLMVNGSNTFEAVEMALKVNLPMGLHLNLSEGCPISNAKHIVDEKGNMFYKELFWNLNQTDEIKREIYEETTAQLEEFRRLTGNYPTHIDGHQHVHIFVAEIIAPLLRQKGICSIRIPDQDPDKLDWLDDKTRQKYERRYVPAVNARLVYNKHDIMSTICFIGLGLSGQNMSVERIKKSLETCNGTVEFMVHPGFTEPLFPRKKEMCDSFDTDKGRKHEYDVLCTMKKYFVQKCDWSYFDSDNGGGGTSP